MAGNEGWAERASDKSSLDEEYVPRPDALSRTAIGKHLYIAYSADAPRATQSMQATQNKPPPADTSHGILGRSVQVQIGRMLRDVFADVADEPVPDRFIKLLEALEAKEKHG
jgi:Anti-sigma factor NepR